MKHILVSYLCGPIGLIPEYGNIEWRILATEEFNNRGIEVLNPYGKGIVDRLAKIKKKMIRWNEEGNINAIRKNSARRLVPPDLQSVKDSDFITCFIPKDNGYEMCGTYGEITLAFDIGKLVYIITNRKQIPNELPQWAIGCSTEVFYSWKEYYDFIDKNINNIRKRAERQRLY